MHNKVREPLFHIVKRDTLPWYQAWGIRAVAIVLALLLCALITTLCTHLNPIKVFGTMFGGAFGSPRKIWILGQNLAILLCISLAVTPAFKMRFWNIGAEGQVLAGGLAAAACMICLGDKLPNGLLIVLIVIAGILAGAVWAVIPAIFKAKWNTNETLFTLMMNYVATQLVAYFIIVWESPKGSGKVGIINQSTEAGWLPQIGGYKYLLTILVVAVLTVLVYVYLNYSKHGYEISVVGESERTARYVGIKVGKVIVRTMLLSCLLGSLLMGLLYCFLTVTLRANQNVTGLAMTTFGVGFGNFMGGSLIKLTGSEVPSIALSATNSYFSKSLPLADKLGWFGQIFLSYGFLAYLAVAIALIAAYVLKHTRVGLHLRSVGENPQTADAAGIDVKKYKYVATCVGSMIAGLGGLYYVMDYACGVWSNDAFGDRGWLAIALVIFTVWKPNIGVLASFLFGGLYILHIFLPSGTNLAVKELYKMIPYVVTIIVLIITSVRSKRENQPPASLGLPYFREER